MQDKVNLSELGTHCCCEVVLDALQDGSGCCLLGEVISEEGEGREEGKGGGERGRR